MLCCLFCSFDRFGCEYIVELVTEFLEEEEAKKRTAAVGDRHQIERLEKKREKEVKRLEQERRREDKLKR